MLNDVVKNHGSYKISNRSRSIEQHLDAGVRSARRISRIVESLRREIMESGDGKTLRIRRVLRDPREIFRLEIALPELGYQRTTLLDRETLDALLASKEIRALLPNTTAYSPA